MFASPLSIADDVLTGIVSRSPVFIVSSMLLISSPPALTVAQVRFSFYSHATPLTCAQISQRVKPTPASGAATNTDTFSAFEHLSRTVFWSYLVLTITIGSIMIGISLIGA